MAIDPGVPDAFESNAGDDFHLQWAARKVLGMLHPRSTLMGVGLDQVHPDDVGRVERSGDSLLGIDLAEYYGGDSFNSANNIVHSQLKYSTRRTNMPWTAARLSPTGADSKNCIIRRLADVYAHYVREFGRDNTLRKLQIKLISNRQCGATLQDALLVAKKYLSNRPSQIRVATLLKAMPSAHAQQISYLHRGVSLTSHEFTDFLRVFDVSECGAPSRLAMDAALVQELGELGFGEARSQYSMLVESIRRRMQPENRGDQPFAKSDVLAALEVTHSDVLYPAPASFEYLPNLIQRDITGDIATQIVEHVHGLICLHGAGGVGKTTLIRQLCDTLPSGSISVLFDCYGSGSYMDHTNKRHTYQRAILQIANELAGKVGTPLLINQDLADEDYTRQLQRRLEAAVRVIRAANPKAIMVLVIDAADNSMSAAERWQEESFVSGLVTMAVPEGCRLVFAARTHRKGQLELPSRALHCEVPPFTVSESQQHVERYCGDVNVDDVSDFCELTRGIPRTQAYALAQCGESIDSALGFLRPGGMTLEHLIDTWLDQAGLRLGDENLAGKICPALLTLTRPVPATWAARLSGVDEATLVDFCLDAGLGFSVHDSLIGFKDEDFESRIGERYTIDEQRYGALADELYSSRHTDGYAAAHVADALCAAGRSQDIVQLLYDDGQPQSIEDPIERTDSFARRAQLAMDWVLAQGNHAELLRLLFVLAESGKADQAVEDLLLREGDLAVRYGKAETVHRLYINQKNTRLGWHGPMHLQCAAQFSRSATCHKQAKNHLDSGEAWIREYFSRPQEDRHNWELTTEDLANGAEAVLRLNGVEAVFAWIAQWRPQNIRYKICHKLASAFFSSDVPFDWEHVWKLMPRYEEVLAIVDCAVNAGHMPPKSYIDHVVRQWARFARTGRQVDVMLCRPGISLCESAAYHDLAPRTILTLLKLFTPEPASHAYFSSAEELADRYGCHLRAFALRETISGREADHTDHSLYPPKPEAEDSDRSDAKLRQWEDNRKKLEKNYSYILPAYLFRARALTEGTSLLDDAKRVFDTALGTGGDEWERNRLHHEHRLVVQLRTRVLADGLIIACEDPLALFTQLYGHIKRLYPAWMAKDLADRAARVPELADQAMSIVTDFVDAIEESPTPASDRVEAFTWACRIGGQIDRNVGGMYFEKAVEAAGEIDSECAAMLQLTARITDKATSGCRAGHDDIALRLAKIVEDSYWQWQENGREFPWNESMDAVAQLSPRTAIAALGRWDQRGILNYAEEMARLTATLAAQGSVGWRTAISIAAHSPITHISALAWGLRVLESVIESGPGGNGDQIDKSLSMLADRACRLVTVDQRMQAIDDLLRWADEHDIRDNAAIVNAHSYRDAIAALQTSDQGHGEQWWKPHRTKATVAEGESNVAEREWTTLIGKCDPFDADAITAAIEDAHATAQGSDMQWEQLKELPTIVLDSIRAKVEIRDRTRHLDALVRVAVDTVSLTDLIKYLSRVCNEWSNSPIVRQWFTQLPEQLAKVRFDEFSYTNFLNWELLTEIEKVFGIPPESMGSALLRASPTHIRDMSPELLYDLGRLVASSLAQGDALDLLRWVIERQSQEVDESMLACQSLVVDRISFEGVGLAAAMLWFLMGHPDKQVRWQAIHAARGAIKLGEDELLGELVEWIDSGPDHPFCALNTVFYSLSAKTWLLILIDRLSEENPSVILPLAALLATEATAPSTPHVMTMHQARNAAIRLAEHRSDIYDSRTLDAINKSLQPPTASINKVGGDGSVYPRYDYRSASTTSFDFDRIDTLPYWYAPAGRVFGVDGSRFCDDTSKVITSKWRISGASYQDDPVHKWKVPDHKWQQCSNGHGSEPAIEDLRRYLEFHAMMCVMASYAQSLQVVPERWDEGNSWDYWLLGWGLSPRSTWLADLRERTPLEPALWNLSERFDGEWLCKFDDRLFDQAVGMVEPSIEDHLVIDGNVRRYQYGSYEASHITSALVSSETSGSLLEALCQCHVHDYRIPPEDDDLEINEKLSDETAFMLRGWLRQDYSDFDALDRYDPFRYDFKGYSCTPGRALRSWIKSQPNRVTVNQSWNDCRQPEDEHGVYTTGSRLWINRDALSAFLASVSADMIIACSVNRSLTNRSYSGLDDNYATQSKLYIIKADGAIIGRRSDPEARSEARA